MREIDDPARRVEAQQARGREGGVHPHPRAHRDLAVVRAHGHQGPGVGLRDQSPHVRIGDAQALVDEGA